MKKIDDEMLSERLRNMIVKRFGREIRYSQDCETLSEDIYARTGQWLGVTTLKRMFGFTAAAVEARRSTMDIVAQYLGYSNGYKELAAALDDDGSISGYVNFRTVDISKLNEGTRVVVRYNPNRRIVMTYVGDGRFRIDESENSKLQAGDVIKVGNLATGFELLAADVVREGRSLGGYRAAMMGGLTAIEVLD
ncbi:MAG: hypothetical protein K2K00_05835 [Muribaculaceae bacterium]|nr:hypothetical protein [Muribaculaceae bacterium]